MGFVLSTKQLFILSSKRRKKYGSYSNLLKILFIPFLCIYKHGKCLHLQNQYFFTHYMWELLIVRLVSLHYIHIIRTVKIIFGIQFK